MKDTSHLVVDRLILRREALSNSSPAFLATSLLPASPAAPFLDSAQDDALYALYHVIALRGLRRGEAVGLSWSDVDLDGGWLLVREQVVVLGWRTVRTTPKAGSERVLALDEGTVQVLREHRRRQQGQLRFLGLDPADTPEIFTRADGQLVHPDYVTRHFARLIKAASLPPIRVHDLRHGAATLALASGVEMKVVQDMLGHSSITITSDTYTSVLPQVARSAAEAAAGMVPRAPREHTAHSELRADHEQPRTTGRA